MFNSCVCDFRLDSTTWPPLAVTKSLAQIDFRVHTLPGRILNVDISEILASAGECHETVDRSQPLGAWSFLWCRHFSFPLGSPSTQARLLLRTLDDAVSEPRCGTFRTLALSDSFNSELPMASPLAPLRHPQEEKRHRLISHPDDDRAIVTFTITELSAWHTGKGEKAKFFTLLEWWSQRDLNPRPLACEASALTN